MSISVTHCPRDLNFLADLARGKDPNQNAAKKKRGNCILLHFLRKIAEISIYFILYLFKYFMCDSFLELLFVVLSFILKDQLTALCTKASLRLASKYTK